VNFVKPGSRVSSARGWPPVYGMNACAAGMYPIVMPRIDWPAEQKTSTA